MAIGFPRGANPAHIQSRIFAFLSSSNPASSLYWLGQISARWTPTASAIIYSPLCQGGRAFASVEELRKRPPINQHQNEVSLAAVKAALAYFGDD
ncbi:hypothetical protein B194_1150 [Serratia plymuthica A30]|nr:hypothetical protein B194_1150 [Serratia plymuthica A30]